MEALTLAYHIAVLRQGRVVQVGTPRDVYDRPTNIFVAQLVGMPRINLLNASHANGTLSVTGSGIQMPLPAGLNGLPSSFTMGIRPEDVQPANAGLFSGQIVLIEPLGIETILHIRSGEQNLLSIVSGNTGCMTRCALTLLASGYITLMSMERELRYNHGAIAHD